MTRSLAVAPDGRGYALGSVEGRVAMELFDQRPEMQALKYAFKVKRGGGGCYYSHWVSGAGRDC
jgi:cell cycle arrest protein BUB3